MYLCCLFKLTYYIPHVISNVNFVGNTFVEAENSPVNSPRYCPSKRKFHLCIYV